MYGYIYLTTNLINGKRYIGRHKKPFFDPYYKGSGVSLTEAFKKYGINNFTTEIIEECESEEELNGNFVGIKYLIKEGFIRRTPRGREVTDLAYQHLKRSRFATGYDNALF